MKIRHLYLSPGHNYFGHHGRPAGEHPIVEVRRVECVMGRGLRGDRFFDYKPDYKGQITFFSWEVFLDLQRTFRGGDLEPGVVRRNAVVEGVELDQLIGSEFTLNDVRMLGVEECRPCYWMDQAIGPGAEAWLRGRGGLRCRILSDGELISERRIWDRSIVPSRSLLRVEG